MGKRRLKIKVKTKKGKITTFGRRGLSKSQFALPATKKGKSRGFKGSYPIDTVARARNAKARVAQFGTPKEKAKVASAVKSKYPQINRADQEWKSMTKGKRG